MTKLSLRLLGPIEAACGEQRIDGFPADKVIALLAYLAVESGVAHPRTSLALLFWPDHPDRKAQGNLRQTLFRLRKTLDASVEGLSDQLLHVTRRTILLKRDSLWLDVADLQEWSAPCAQQNGAASLERCREIAAGYRGDFMSGLALRDAPEFDEWQTVIREQSLRQVQALLYSLADRYAEAGEVDQAVRLARRQLVLEPWREEAHRQLMRNLARTGHERQALAQYEACRAILEEEWGGEPSEETNQLYLAIRSHSLFPAASPQTENSRLPAQERLVGFPRSELQIVGREDELSAVQGFFARPNRRLMTVTGIGGMGKRWLVAEAAAQMALSQNSFAGGAVYIDAQGVSTVDELAAKAASALGVSVSDGASPMDRLCDELQGMEILLVLPNLHRIHDGVEFVAKILASTSQVCILATSLFATSLPGERTLALSGLRCDSASTQGMVSDGDISKGRRDGALDIENLPAAARALLLLAQNHRPNWMPGVSELRWILRLCRLMDGMPLALSAAASWTRFMDLPAVARAVEDNSPSFLSAEVRDEWNNRRSLQAEFEEAWEHLPEAAQRALAQMSAFQDGAGIEAVYAVVNPDRETLATLIDRGLVHWQDGRRTAMGRLLRQFALQKLADSPPLQQVTIQRFTSHYLRLVQDAEDLLRGAVVDDEWLERIVDELANVRVAWRWTVDSGDLAEAADVLHSVCLSFERSAQYEEALGMVNACLERTSAWRETQEQKNNVDLKRLIARLLAEQAWFLWRLNHFADASQAIAASLDQAPDSVPPSDISFAYLTLGLIEDSRGRYAGARDAYARSLEICEETGDRMQTGRVLNFLGAVTRILGDFDEAERLHEQSLAIGQHLSDRWGIASTLHNLGIDLHRLGRLERGRAVFQEAIVASEAIDDPWAVHVSQISYADLEIDAGRFDSARSLLEASRTWAQTTGNLWGEAYATTVFGRLDRVTGSIAMAENRLYKALELWRKVVDDRGTARTLNELGLTELARQRYTTSAELLYRALELAYRMDANARCAEILGALALLLAESGRSAQAIRIATFLRDFGAATGRVRQELAAIPLDATDEVADGHDSASPARREVSLEQMIDFAREAAGQYFPASLSTQ